MGRCFTKSLPLGIHPFKGMRRISKVVVDNVAGGCVHIVAYNIKIKREKNKGPLDGGGGITCLLGNVLRCPWVFFNTKARTRESRIVHSEKTLPLWEHSAQRDRTVLILPNGTWQRKRLPTTYDPTRVVSNPPQIHRHLDNSAVYAKKKLL